MKKLLGLLTVTPLFLTACGSAITPLASTTAPTPGLPGAPAQEANETETNNEATDFILTPEAKEFTDIISHVSERFKTNVEKKSARSTRSTKSTDLDTTKIDSCETSYLEENYTPSKFYTKVSGTAKLQENIIEDQVQDFSYWRPGSYWEDSSQSMLTLNGMKKVYDKTDANNELTYVHVTPDLIGNKLLDNAQQGYTQDQNNKWVKYDEMEASNLLINLNDSSKFGCREVVDYWAGYRDFMGINTLEVKKTDSVTTTKYDITYKLANGGDAHTVMNIHKYTLLPINYTTNITNMGRSGDGTYKQDVSFSGWNDTKASLPSNSDTESSTPEEEVFTALPGTNHGYEFNWHLTKLYRMFDKNKNGELLTPVANSDSATSLVNPNITSINSCETNYEQSMSTSTRKTETKGIARRDGKVIEDINEIDSFADSKNSNYTLDRPLGIYGMHRIFDDASNQYMINISESLIWNSWLQQTEREAYDYDQEGKWAVYKNSNGKNNRTNVQDSARLNSCKSVIGFWAESIPFLNATAASFRKSVSQNVIRFTVVYDSRDGSRGTTVMDFDKHTMMPMNYETNVQNIYATSGEKGGYWKQKIDFSGWNSTSVVLPWKYDRIEM